MANDAETTTTTPAVVESTPVWKQFLGYGIALILLFVMIWVISRAWKKGQQAPAA